MTEFSEFLAGFEKDGQRVSEGHFRWNLERAIGLLSDYQLKEHSDYVLRLLASAVAGGASRFELKKLKGGVLIGWDGRSLKLEELQELFPSVLSGDSVLAELAVALNSARRLYPSVVLRTQGGSLSIRGSDLEVSSRDCTRGYTEIELLRPRWRDWLSAIVSGGEADVIRRRCALAPLELCLSGHGPSLDFTDVPVLQFGRPDVSLPGARILLTRDVPASHGSGYLALGNPEFESALHHFGVGFPLPRSLELVSARLAWWKEDLALDLSRSGIAETPEFEQWWTWLEGELEDALLEALATGPITPALKLVLEWFLVSDVDIDHVPAFRWADGTPATLMDLRERFESQGYLATTTRLWECDNGLNPATILLLDEVVNGLRERLPHWISVDHLREAERVPTLPAGSNCIARWPSTRFVGEIGLGTTRSLVVETYREGMVKEKRHGLPFSLKVACLLKEVPTVYAGDGLKILYYRHGIDDDLRLFQVLNLLLWQSASAFPSGTKPAPLTKLLADYPIPTSEKPISATGLRRILKKTTVPRKTDSRITLLELRGRGRDWDHGDLLLDSFTAQALGYLLTPGWTRDIWFPFNAALGWSYGPLTLAAERAISGGTANSILRCLISESECSALLVLNRILTNLDGLTGWLNSVFEPTPKKGPRPTVPLEIQSLVQAAVNRDPIIATESLLLGLVLENFPVSEVLREQGVTEEAIREAVQELELCGREQLVDIGELLKFWKGKRRGELLANRSGRYLRLERFAEALDDALEALEYDPHARFQLGLCRYMSGDTEGALIDYESAIELEPLEPEGHYLYAEALDSLGRREEAWAALREAVKIEPEMSGALALKAKFLMNEQPEEAMKLCSQSIELREGSTLAWETKAGLHLSKGERTEAIHCLEKVLEFGTPQNFLVPDRRTRVNAAQAQLDKMLSHE